MRNTHRFVAAAIVAGLGGVAVAALAAAQTTPTTQTTTTTTQSTSTTQTTTTTTTTTTTQPTPTGATVAIDNCHVKRSRAGGGFAWFYCGVVTDTPGTRTITVRYSVNLPVFKPPTGGTWRTTRTGTLRFTGGGPQLLNLKLAVRNRSVSQVRKSLRVTLSDAQGATITDGTARAASS
jgi:hypothetical protein